MSLVPIRVPLDALPPSGPMPSHQCALSCAYARVSTVDQDLETQLAKLKAEGCGIIRSEKVSGGSREGRTELATIIEFLRPGDELVVTRLDRLGRDTRDVLNIVIVHECDQRQAFVTVLDPRICTRGEAGRIVMTVLGMVAQMERRLSRSVSARVSRERRMKASTGAASAVWTGRR
jgi:DNA invertase Pin-like site-specific DNA recombinase